MTALTEYQRLESAGTWRGSPDDQRRDVVVSLGDATLVVYDGANRALAHWSLAATIRRNPGRMPAVFVPGTDTLEELEVTDEEFAKAIDRIRATIERRRPRRGRLRLVLFSLALIILGTASYLWLPDTLIRHASEVVPPAKRTELGHRLLAQVSRLSGKPCETTMGTHALGLLHARLLPDTSGRLIIIDRTTVTTAHLPGGTILLNRTLVEDYDTPDVVAGFVLEEATRAAQSDPMYRLLSHAGAMAAARLLTTGDIPEQDLASYAENLMTTRHARVEESALIEAFNTAQVSTTPYAYALDITGSTTLPLIEAESDLTFAVLPDQIWVGLQGICET